jgi:hypothetical protein
MRLNQDRREERGSMIVALAVIMILTMLSIAVVTRTLSGLRSARQGQDFAGALPQADAGLSDALFRIDQQGNAAAATFCVGVSGSCSLTTVPNASGAQYTARRVNDNTYTVLSKGTVNGQYHAIQATVSRPASLYPFALFGSTSVTIKGYATPMTTLYPTGWPAGTVVPADIGSSGQINCNAGNPADHEDYYKGGGAASCPTPVQMPGTYLPADPASTCPAAANTPPTPCLPTSPAPLACPSIPSSNYVLAAGVYVCYDSQSWTGATVTVAGSQNGGVAEIYFFKSTPTSPNPTFTMTQSSFNVGGSSANLRLYFGSAYTIDPGPGTNTTSFTGVLYAPHATLTSNACKANWVGSLLVDNFTCNGAAGEHFSVLYDAALSTVRPPGGWKVTNFMEIPSAQVILP